jgi:hypothetical protein
MRYHFRGILTATVARPPRRRFGEHGSIAPLRSSAYYFAYFYGAFRPHKDIDTFVDSDILLATSD